jgi:hypothetical protein
VHSYFRTTRRLRKDRLVACVTAKAITCRICGKLILASAVHRSGLPLHPAWAGAPHLSVDRGAGSG